MDTYIYIYIYMHMYRYPYINMYYPIVATQTNYKNHQNHSKPIFELGGISPHATKSPHESSRTCRTRRGASPGLQAKESLAAPQRTMLLGGRNIPGVCAEKMESSFRVKRQLRVRDNQPEPVSMDWLMGTSVGNHALSLIKCRGVMLYSCS